MRLTRRARASPRGYAFCPARPERPLWRRDGLGAPDILLGRAGRKGLLGRATGSAKMSDAPKKAIGDGLGDATGDALSSSLTWKHLPGEGKVVLDY